LRGTGTLFLDAASALGRRAAARAAWPRRPLSFPESRTALLFFEDVEADRFFGGDRLLRRGARKLYHAVTRGPAISGFEVWFRSLRRALESAGWRVLVNQPEIARRNPTYPIGLLGYPHVLEAWDLPNPAVLGPGLFDHPALAPRLMADPRFRVYLVTCEWMRQLFARSYGDACRCWHAGIDLSAWPDLSGRPKDLDFIVYDKIRWDRARREVELLRPLRAELRRRGLSVRELRYGRYDLSEYRALLARARGLVYLAEHETQGFAYQEAMATGTPILAWDPGLWLDPARSRWEPDPVPASSVPYFSPGCGERFMGPDELPGALERFLAARASYRPRRFVEERLSMEESARAWIGAAAQAARAV
jgi:hypothetical protein